MKIRFALAFALLVLALTAAVPPVTASIAACLDQCDAIRAMCDAGCSTSQCHRECRDSAVRCVSRCQTGG